MEEPTHFTTSFKIKIIHTTNRNTNPFKNLNKITLYDCRVFGGVFCQFGIGVSFEYCLSG